MIPSLSRRRQSPIHTTSASRAEVRRQDRGRQGRRIVEQTSYGQFIHMLCEETTGDERFTVGERIHNPGTETEPGKSDSEAVHILEGEGTLRVCWTGLPAAQWRSPSIPAWR